MNHADKGRLQVLADLESGRRWWAASASDITLCQYLLDDGIAIVAERRDGVFFGAPVLERRLALTPKGVMLLAELRERVRLDHAEPGWWAWIEHETWWEFIAGRCTKGEALAAAAAYNAELDACR